MTAPERRQRATAAENDYQKAKLQLARVVGLPLGQPFTLSTDGPEMLRTYLREELNMLLRTGILSFEEVEAAITRERVELERRVRAYRGDRSPLRLDGRVVAADRDPGEGVHAVAGIGAVNM